MDDMEEYTEILARAAAASDLDFAGLLVYAYDRDNASKNLKLAACFHEASRRLLEQGQYRQSAKAVYEGSVCLKDVGNQEVVELFARNAINVFNRIHDAGFLIEDAKKNDVNSVPRNIGYAFGELNQHGYSRQTETAMAQALERYTLDLCLANYANRAVIMAKDSLDDDPDDDGPLNKASKNFLGNVAFWQKVAARGVKPPTKSVDACAL